MAKKTTTNGLDSAFTAGDARLDLTQGTGRFNDRLREAKGGMSIQELANLIGSSSSVVHQYLRGTSEPTRPKLIALSKACGVRVEWLASGTGPMYDMTGAAVRFTDSRPRIKERSWHIHDFSSRFDLLRHVLKAEAKHDKDADPSVLLYSESELLTENLRQLISEALFLQRMIQFQRLCGQFLIGFFIVPCVQQSEQICANIIESLRLLREKHLVVDFRGRTMDEVRSILASEDTDHHSDLVESLRQIVNSRKSVLVLHDPSRMAGAPMFVIEMIRALTDAATGAGIDIHGIPGKGHVVIVDDAEFLQRLWDNGHTNILVHAHHY